jgi:hypothetical protein
MPEERNRTAEANDASVTGHEDKDEVERIE